MALGGYTSVSTQNEQLDLEVAKERHELATNPVRELQELTDLWEARGLEAPLALAVAEQLSRDPEQALRVHAVSELGLDPAGKPSPVIAAVSSFSRFAVGAVVPLLPYLFGAPRLWLALLLGGVGWSPPGPVGAVHTATVVVGGPASVALRCRGGRGDLPDRAGDRRPARSAPASHFERQAFFRRRMSHSRMTTRITAEPSR
ncbi:MAG: Conserved rane protein of unknown function [Modestobacter sp.]|jgi:hypothetical protein|nr:Conserved rane protein of unknown function [Modestobacter sp.]